jgi:regulator of protease activity HflC (stomatin/prohibitin superfamily)
MKLMIQFEELRLRLLESEKPMNELAGALGLEAMAKEVAELEEKTAAEDFWGDLANSQKVLQRIASLKGKIKAYEDLKTAYEDALVMIELSDEEGDLDLLPDCEESVAAVEADLEKQTLATLLSGEYDNNNAILSASVKYTISDPVAFALAVKDPGYIINAAISNAMINVAASYAVDDILTTGKDAYTKAVREMSQKKLDESGIGVKLSHLELTRVGMPEEVRDIYELVNSTNIQASTRIEQARQYYETRIPGAEAEADALIAEARANYSNFTAAANSDLYEFYGVLDEYNANPEVVRVRLYSNAITNILRKIGTVRVVDDSDSLIIIN